MFIPTFLTLRKPYGEKYRTPELARRLLLHSETYYPIVALVTQIGAFGVALLDRFVHN